MHNDNLEGGRRPLRWRVQARAA